MKLTHRAIKEYRQQTLSLQGNRCLLCEEPADLDAVLDHDHKTGLIRGVLHRGCNSMLGKIENAMPRSQINTDRLKIFSQNLYWYVMTQHTDILHPKHKEQDMYKKKGKKPPKR